MEEEFTEDYCKYIVREPKWLLNDAVLYINGISVHKAYIAKYCPETKITVKIRKNYQKDMSCSRTYSLAKNAAKDGLLENLEKEGDTVSVAPKEFLLWAMINKIVLNPQLEALVNYRYWTKRKEWSFNEAALIIGSGLPVFPHEISTPFESTNNVVFNIATILWEKIKEEYGEEIQLHSFALTPIKWMHLIEENLRIIASEASKTSKHSKLSYYSPNDIFTKITVQLDSDNKSPSQKSNKGCKKQILEELNRRARRGLLEERWKDEIKYMVAFSKTLDREYAYESMKNIVLKRVFLAAQKKFQNKKLA